MLAAGELYLLVDLLPWSDQYSGRIIVGLLLRCIEYMSNICLTCEGWCARCLRDRLKGFARTTGESQGMCSGVGFVDCCPAAVDYILMNYNIL